MIGVGLACLAATAGCQDPEGAGDTDGPLIVNQPSAWAIESTPGRVFTDGWNSVALPDGITGRLTSVELVAADGLELVGTRVLAPDADVVGLQWAPVFPPARWKDEPFLLPLAGSRIGTLGDGQLILLGLKTVRLGRLSYEGLRIRYVADGVEHTARVYSNVYVCSTSTGVIDVDDRCPLPEEYPTGASAPLATLTGLPSGVVRATPGSAAPSASRDHG